MQTYCAQLLDIFNILNFNYKICTKTQKIKIYKARFIVIQAVSSQ